MTKERIAELRALCERATPGPYRIERVDHEPDEITYEVSAGKEFFHVVFRESECADVGVCAKEQAELYAEARTALPEALDAIEALQKENELLDLVRRRAQVWFVEIIKGTYDCPHDTKAEYALDEIKEILEGKNE